MYAKLLAGAGVAFLLTTAQASATSVFSDDFNRDSFCVFGVCHIIDNHWQQSTYDGHVDLVHVNGSSGDNQLKLTAQAPHEGDSPTSNWVYQTVHGHGLAVPGSYDGSTMQSLTLSFDFAAFNADSYTSADDSIVVEWKYDSGSPNGGSGFTTLASILLTTTDWQNTGALTFSALAGSDIDILITADIGGHKCKKFNDCDKPPPPPDEGAYIDNVSLVTTEFQPPVGETPLPAGLPLFLSGAGVFCFMLRKRRRTARASV